MKLEVKSIVKLREAIRHLLSNRRGKARWRQGQLERCGEIGGEFNGEAEGGSPLPSQ